MLADYELIYFNQLLPLEVPILSNDTNFMEQAGISDKLTITIEYYVLTVAVLARILSTGKRGFKLRIFATQHSVLHRVSEQRFNFRITQLS